jgi:hypothetical protein
MHPPENRHPQSSFYYLHPLNSLGFALEITSNLEHNGVTKRGEGNPVGYTT